jgi:hypothetical protein
MNLFVFEASTRNGKKRLVGQHVNVAILGKKLLRKSAIFVQFRAVFSHETICAKWG